MRGGGVDERVKLWESEWMQWCTFLSVSGHRPIKIPKDQLYQPPQDLGPIKIQSWCFVSYCFDDAVNKPAIIFPPNSSLRSEQNTNVLTSASGQQGHHVLAEVSGHIILHGQSALCFVGSTAEPKITLWSETTLWQLFQDWLSVTWTSTFRGLVRSSGGTLGW